MKKKHVNTLSFCGDYVRKHASDYFFCALLIPVTIREHVFRLLVFYMEITRAVSLVSSWSVAGPMAGLIRLQWWRDIILGQQDRAHELAPFLLESIQEGFLRIEDLLILIEAREAELDGIKNWDHWHKILLNSAGQLQKMIAGLVGVKEEGFLENIRFLGAGCETVYMARSLPILLQAGRFPLPQSIMENYAFNRSDEGIFVQQEAIEEIRQLLIQKAQIYFKEGKKACFLGRKTISAILPIVLAQRDLQRVQQWDHITRNRGVGDKLAVIKANLMGRIKV